MSTKGAITRTIRWGPYRDKQKAIANVPRKCASGSGSRQIMSCLGEQSEVSTGSLAGSSIAHPSSHLLSEFNLHPRLLYTHFGDLYSISSPWHTLKWTQTPKLTSTTPWPKSSPPPGTRMTTSEPSSTNKTSSKTRRPSHTLGPESTDDMFCQKR